jgi:hypothetical protein
MRAIRTDFSKRGLNRARRKVNHSAMKSGLPSILAPLRALQINFPFAASSNFSAVTIQCRTDNSRQLATE